MKKFRKISALILALALICALAVSVFADTLVTGTSGSVHTYDVYFHTQMSGDGTFAQADAIIETPGYLNFDGTIYLNYTYCPDDQMRPSSYQTGSKTYAFSRYSTVKYLRYVPSSGYVMIEATGKTQITKTVNGAVYSTPTAPVTVTLY